MAHRPSQPGPGTAFLERAAGLLVRRPLAALAFAALLLVAVAPALTRLRFDSSVERLMDEDDPARAVLSEAVDTFGSDDVLVIAQIGETPVLEAGRLGRLRALSDAVRAVPGVKQVWSLTTAGHVRGTPDGIEIEDLAANLPTDPAALAALRTDVGSSPLYRRQLLSEDGRTAAVVVFPEPGNGDPFFRDRLVSGIRAVIAGQPGPERLVMSGNPSVTVDIAATMERDQNLFSGLTVLVLAGVLALLFRNGAATLLPLLASGVAVVLVLGVMTALGRSISVLSTIVPSLVLAVGTTYAMHMVYRYGAGSGTPRERAGDALRELALPIALSALTTMAGFAALAANRIAAIREFGWLSAAAVACAVLCVLLVLPAGLAALRPRLRAPDRLPGGPLLASVERLTLRHPTAILVTSAVLMGAAAVGASRLYVDTSYVDFLRHDHPANRDRRTILQHLAGPIPLLVLLDTGADDAALKPDVLSRVAAFQRYAEGIPHVHASISLADLVGEMNRAWHMDEPAPDRFRTVPDDAGLAAQFLLLYESSAFADDLDRLVDFHRRRLAVWLRTELYSSRDAQETVAAVQGFLDNRLADLHPRVTGTLYLLFRSSDEIARGQARSLVVAMAAIGIVMTAMLRSLRLGLLAAIPNLLPILLMFGAMGWLGVSLNVGTCVVACLVLGVATDDTIHFTLHYRETLRRLGDPDAALHATHASVGRPILYTSIALFVAFAVLTGSEFRPIVDLGWLTALTMVSCILGDLLLLPVLLRRFGGS